VPALDGSLLAAASRSCATWPRGGHLLQRTLCRLIFRGPTAYRAQLPAPHRCAAIGGVDTWPRRALWAARRAIATYPGDLAVARIASTAVADS